MPSTFDFKVDSLGFIYGIFTIYNEKTEDDIAIIKYDSLGKQQWIKWYKSSGYISDNAFALNLDRFGNMYVTGIIDSSWDSPDKILIIKYDKNGLQQSVDHYTTNNHVEIYETAVDNIGNLFIFGSSYKYENSGHYNLQYWALKCSSFGKKQLFINIECSNETRDINMPKFAFDGYDIYVMYKDDKNFIITKYDSTGIKKCFTSSDSHKIADGKINKIALDSLENMYILGSDNEDFITIKYNKLCNIQWIAKFNSEIGFSYNEAKDLFIDDSCNVYVIGKSTDDFATIKYNTLGEHQWEARYNGFGFWDEKDPDDEPNALAVDNIGNVYVAGSTMNYYRYRNSEIVTIKYDRNGIQKWINKYSSLWHGIGNALAIDSSYNVYVAGSISSKPEYAIIKYDKNGNREWIETYLEYNCNAGGGATAIAVDESGDIYLVGRCYPPSTHGDIYLYYDFQSKWIPNSIIKYNKHGKAIWYYSDDYSYPGREPTSIMIDNSRNIYVTGNLGDDYLTEKYTSTGIKEWVFKHECNREYGMKPSMALDISGNVYVTGSIALSEIYPPNYNYKTIKLNTHGKVQWTAYYNSKEDSTDIATAITVDIEGCVYVTGYSWSGKSFDYATIKYDTNGKEQWNYRYNGEGDTDDRAVDIGLDALGNIYVTGTSKGDDWSMFTTVKYNRMPDSIKK